MFLEPVNINELSLTRVEILNWLLERDENRISELWDKADSVRKAHVGDDVHLRGIIAISNYCARSCLYCGINAANTGLNRYRMSLEEILDVVKGFESQEFYTVVLQSGENPGMKSSWITELVRRIKSETNLAITLSLGERSESDLAEWREAGADRYLLKFETSNSELYESLNPGKSGRWEKRLEVLNSLDRLEYEVGSGIMVGIPRQRFEDLVNDLQLFRELNLDMIGIGPYIPHPASNPGRILKPTEPDLDQVPNDELTTCKMLSLTRLLLPLANIPSTTSLSTISNGDEGAPGLRTGANVVMPDITPLMYKRYYDIYPSYHREEDTDYENRNRHLKESICSLGRKISDGPGTSLNFIARHSLSQFTVPEIGIDDNSGRQKIALNTKNPGEINFSHSLTEGSFDFINDSSLLDLLNETVPDETSRVRDIIEKSLAKEPLTVDETAVLLRTENPELHEEMFAAARRLKQEVYGNRIVLFAPLYIGNECENDCRYCGFRISNPDAVRRTLSKSEVIAQVKTLENQGHKRLILVFGEHSDYSPEFIAENVRTVYATENGFGEIRRVNINAPPLDIEGFSIVHASGIGTYQIFQETYHHDTYKRMHPANTRKGDYLYRLNGLSRAFEAGCDDVGIGALFGLFDWRFEILGLVSHASYLQQRYGVGPHTISFPRLRPASGVNLKSKYLVNDQDFKKLVAILRLSVPYTGMILTARENEDIRREVMEFGVSQIDAGSRIEIGGYTKMSDTQQVIRKEQFQLGDMRSLDEVICQLLENDQIPSFCTACYRIGRTGEHFMEYAIPGFIERFCTPNAILTLMEYLVDYGSGKAKNLCEKVITANLDKVDDKVKPHLLTRITKLKKTNDRDFYF
ncbi:MAG: [FeFe] hydrogenase H-cluster radical SAM maturase HydG [Candidatus Electryonea clarkiae]|nr:[FeFe] hydrogenase H-cluster radical SAM maturase HydG [Candidatus Electryonea clarkiae]MDP8285967.1 [FeFe] hydrogenase H-cluster radical SAM maturase HydG [Candidatus Electryonea clarkiae]